MASRHLPYRWQNLAHRLTRRENHSIAEAVERALEAYDARGRAQPASSLHARVTTQAAIDPDAVIRESRQPHQSIEL